MISLCVQAQLSFKLSDQNTVFVKSVISTVCRDSSQSCTDTRGLFISQIRMCPIYFLLSETFYLLYHMFINCVILTVALPFYLSFMSVCCLMCDDSLILCTWILVNSSPTPPILLLWSKHLNGSQSDISGFYEPLRLKSFIQGRSTVQKSQGTQMSLYFFFRKTDAAIYWKMQKQMGMQLLREKQSSLVTSRTWKPMFVWTAFIL